MNELQVFNNDEFGSIRTVIIENEPWFVGKDVVGVLGYADVSHTILDHVDEEDRVNSKTQGQNAPELGQRGSWLINESGLYSLILSSKLPTAKKFKHWVTSEVLPAIYKTGSYSKSMSVLEIIQHSINHLVEQEHKLKAIEVQQIEQAKRLNSIESRLEILSGGNIETTGRDRLNAMMRTYINKKGISYAEGWKDFKKMYNRVLHTCLGTLITNYTKKNNLKGKPTIPRFLERTNRLDDGLMIAQMMLNLISGLQGE